jgi:cupin fold WbuC family metalloprotein
MGESDMKSVTRADLAALCAAAAETPRRRLNRNLHDTLEDPIQRLLNALEPGTYVRPHRHGGGRWETFVALSGLGAVLTFDDQGRVLDRLALGAQADDGVLAVEIPGGTWHSVLALTPGTAMFETKPGPYRPTSDKDFAAWAPAEGDPAAPDLARWMESARPGARWPGASALLARAPDTVTP